MAKLYIDRLKRKFGSHNLVTGRLSLLMQDIIAFNSNTIAKKIAKINQDGWNKGLRKITKEEKPFIVPSVNDVLPKRSVFILKAAKDGDMISQTLRDSLTKNLRDTLNQFTPKTKESTYIQRRGVGAGRINPKLIDQFQKSITDTFSGYTKKDPKIGMPSNIHAIAVTEMRSTIDDINEQYIDGMRARNPDMRIRKQWIQNRSLSHEPRRGHSAVNGMTIDIDDYFEVPLYRKIMGKEMIIEYTPMRRPHDPSASPEQVICCSCEVKYLIKRVSGETMNKSLNRIYSGLKDIVLKAKALPPGTKRQHADGWYEKQQNGDWTKIVEHKDSNQDKSKEQDKPKESQEEKNENKKETTAIPEFKTTQDAIKWFNDNGIKEIDLGKMKLNEISIYANIYNDIKNELKIEGMNKLVVAKIGKSIMRGGAQGITINPRYIGDVEMSKLKDSYYNWNQNINDKIKFYEDAVSKGAKFEQTLKELHETVKYRFFIYVKGNTINDLRETLFTHEMGHFIWGNAINKERFYGVENKWLSVMRKMRDDGTLYKISKYANSIHQEGFAESFSINRFEPDLLPDYVKKVINDIIKISKEGE